MKEPKLVLGEYKGRPNLELKMEGQKSCFWKVTGTALVLGIAAYFSHGGITNGYYGWQKGTPIKEDVRIAYMQIDEVVIEPVYKLIKREYNQVKEDVKKDIEILIKSQNETTENDLGKDLRNDLGNDSGKDLNKDLEENLEKDDLIKDDKENSGLIDNLYQRMTDVHKENIRRTIEEAEKNSKQYFKNLNEEAGQTKKKHVEDVLAFVENESNNFIDELYVKAQEMREEGIKKAIRDAEDNAKFIDELYRQAKEIGEERLMTFVNQIGEENFMKLLDEVAKGNDEVKKQLQKYII